MWKFSIFLTVVFGFTISYCSSSKMVIMWGYPTKTFDKITMSVSDWDACVSTCESDVNCVFVFSESQLSTPTSCDIYYFTLVKTVQLTDKNTNQGIFAIKLDLNQCGASLANNFPAGVTTPSGNMNATWNSDNNTISLGYAFEKCYDKTSWIAVLRNGRTWCMMLTYSSPKLRSKAIELCATGNSTLAGITSPYEAILFGTMLRNNVAPMATATGQYWVDGIRNKYCSTSTKVLCDIFDITNGYKTISMNNSLFASGEPSRMSGGVMENCVTMTANGLNSGKPALGTKCLSDMNCDVEAQGYICGKWKD